MTVSVVRFSMSDPDLGGPFENVNSVVVMPNYIVLVYSENRRTSLPTNGRIYSVYVESK